MIGTTISVRFRGISLNYPSPLWGGWLSEAKSGGGRPTGGYDVCREPRCRRFATAPTRPRNGGATLPTRGRDWLPRPISFNNTSAKSIKL